MKDETDNINQENSDNNLKNPVDNYQEIPDNSVNPKSFILANVEDTKFHQEIEKLHQLTVMGRWLVVVLLWATIGLWSLWGLRSEIALWREHFTWVALRYGLAYNRLPSLGLALCIGMTTAVLMWQSRNILFGRPPKLQQHLEKQVCRIRQQGPSHPLWQIICR